MKTVVVIPTYNERENVPVLLDKIDSLAIEDLEIVVVDDNSPDGTWEVVEDRMKESPHVHILRRMCDRGRGLAGISGFEYALEIGGEVIVEMDGDLSHDPSYIPDFLRAIEESDVVLGSRFVKEGGSLGRDFCRNIISRMAGLYVRLILGFKVKDPTSGYRCFRRRVLEEIDLGSLRAKGPFIVSEVLFRCYSKRFKISEVPIVFRERLHGKSKFGFGVLLKNLIGILKLRVSGY